MAADRPRGEGRGGGDLASADRRGSAEPNPAPSVTLTTVPGRPGSPDLRLVCLAGDVNRRCVPRVELALAELEGHPGAAQPSGAPLHVIDLTNVRYLDDGAVRALFALADRFAAAGRTLHVVAGARSESERVARIMQLETFVAVHHTLDDVVGLAGDPQSSSAPPD